mmetsp:Transcript_10658/g.27679  ORF Transcript_10658/g.27679 Transcript_10658/m.27679 type:complete len:202 (-) Transcript_10658:45-650(-)
MRLCKCSVFQRRSTMSPWMTSRISCPPLMSSRHGAGARTCHGHRSPRRASRRMWSCASTSAIAWNAEWARQPGQRAPSPRSGTASLAGRPASLRRIRSSSTTARKSLRQETRTWSSARRWSMIPRQAPPMRRLPPRTPHRNPPGWVASVMNGNLSPGSGAESERLTRPESISTSLTVSVPVRAAVIDIIRFIPRPPVSVSD